MARHLTHPTKESLKALEDALDRSQGLRDRVQDTNSVAASIGASLYLPVVLPMRPWHVPGMGI